MKITEFYNTDYVNFSSYDNIRKIASYIDGQKNASRKVLYTVLEKNIKSDIKCSQLGSKCAEFSEYLHGNMDGVIVNLAQDFTGTNNIALLQKSGNFGTRFTPEASASRYIFTHGSNMFFDLFKKEDSEILKQQFFEGEQIEPVFYVPSLPILLINGSEGVSSGFAQKILPRCPEKIKNYLKNHLSGKKSRYNFEPYFNGFKGSIEQGETQQQWIINGVVTRKGINKVEISEIPIGYDLKSYLNVLDTLEEKKIIQSYRDKSENDNFLFEVNIASKSLKEWSDQDLLTNLKLTKKVSENYTVIDEDNKIAVLQSPKEILDKYIEIKLQYIDKRKNNEIKKIKEIIDLDLSKYNFIKAVVEDKLKINKRKKEQIVNDLKKIDNISERDGSYDYLLQMNILSLTTERMQKLKNTITENKKKMTDLNNKTIKEIWLDDLQ